VKVTWNGPAIGPIPIAVPAAVGVEFGPPPLIAISDGDPILMYPYWGLRLQDDAKSPPPQLTKFATSVCLPEIAVNSAEVNVPTPAVVLQIAIIENPAKE